MNTHQIKSTSRQYLINTYGERKLALVKGSGTSVWDADGNEYLDCFAGISVDNLGHCHPKIVEAAIRQMKSLIHVSNLYYTEPQSSLAEKLADATFADKWFFCNSGAEANEAAIKLVRKFWNEKGTNRHEIIAMENSFHGRTMMTLSATGQKKHHRGFGPMVPGFVHVPFNDIAAVDTAMTDSTAAVLVEPIQGEGGVVPADQSYLRDLRELCDERSVLLVFDEVQTGMGRTGHLFAYQHYKVEPDIITVAKALAGGLPMGAIGARDPIAMVLGPGTHASTFGGNPVCAAAANAVLDLMNEPGFFDGVRAVSRKLFDGVRTVAGRHNCVTDVRGVGLMMGVELTCPVGPVVEAFMEHGIIVGPAGQHVLRFLPPLIIQDNEVERVVETLDSVLGKYDA
ncbi:MAG: acetylornithine transaminase [Candidatus Hydrogenedentes bacterium]|nr:acetylornithine transaminase [Candidatus Hydrogenedentota bacterium]